LLNKKEFISSNQMKSPKHFLLITQWGESGKAI